MSRFGRLAALAVPAIAVVAMTTSSASAVGTPQSTIPSAVPWANTPAVLNNAVQGLAQAGNRIIVSGDFTQEQDATANGGATFNQPYVFSFNPTSGAIDRSFRVTANNVVNKVIAGPNNTVYLAGAFTTINGTSVSRVAQVSLTTGQLTSFRPPTMNAQASDLTLAGSRLLVGGNFTTVGGTTHGGLASLNPTTGALDPYLGVNVSGHHNFKPGSTPCTPTNKPNCVAQGAVGVENFALSPDGTRLVVIGNFTTADGLARDQAMVVRLTQSGASVDPNWETDVYTSGCYTFAFDSYMRDVQFAPDGSYFAIATTGGSNPGTYCDTVTRWEASSSGQKLTPTWTAYTGGDTNFSIALTGTAVYMGGHSRWLNNPYGSDNAGAGAVPRPGMAAVDPRTGIPLAWNPGRNPRGLGAQALLATSTGLYVGSDTEYIGNRQYVRKRLAYFPLAGGYALPAEKTNALPGTVVMAGRATATGGNGVDAVVTRSFDGTTPGADGTLATGGTNWGLARGGFLVDGNLYYGYPNPNAGNAYYLYERTFDGSTFGPATVLDPYNDPKWSNVSAGINRWTQTVEYYRGLIPNFYGAQLASVSGAFFSNGVLYYTKTGSQGLYARPFSTDSGIVGATERTVATSGFGDVAGMFLSGNTLYWSSTGGQLIKAAFNAGTVGAASTADTSRNWSSRIMVVGSGGGGNPATQPQAAFTSNCSGLACTFDGSGSTDQGGSLTTWSWNFGDGQTGSGSSVSHTFSAGTWPVTLTVTDDHGATNSVTHSVTVSSTTPSGTIGFRGVAQTDTAQASSGTVAVPSGVQAGDGLVLTVSVNSGSVTVGTPAGWNLERTVASGNLQSSVFSRVATASDAGTSVTVPLSGATAKMNLQLSAYSGTSGSDPVASVTAVTQTGGTSHVTPTAAAASGDWVLSLWADKQSAARTWSPPSSGVTVRSNLAATGTGDVATLLVDSGAPVPSGQAGGLTATVPTASNQAAMVTILLTP